MGLWLVIQLLLGSVFYTCTTIACGYGGKEADRLQNEAAAQQQAQQRQQLARQEQQKTSSQERSREGAKPETSSQERSREGAKAEVNGSREGEPQPRQQPLPQHPPPAPIPGQSKEKEVPGANGFFTAFCCEVLTTVLIEILIRVVK